jgi:hypothetical protein
VCDGSRVVLEDAGSGRALWSAALWQPAALRLSAAEHRAHGPRLALRLLDPGLPAAQRALRAAQAGEAGAGAGPAAAAGGGAAPPAAPAAAALPPHLQHLMRARDAAVAAAGAPVPPAAPCAAPGAPVTAAVHVAGPSVKPSHAQLIQDAGARALREAEGPPAAPLRSSEEAVLSPAAEGLVACLPGPLAAGLEAAAQRPGPAEGPNSVLQQQLRLCRLQARLAAARTGSAAEARLRARLTELLAALQPRGATALSGTQGTARMRDARPYAAREVASVRVLYR